MQSIQSKSQLGHIKPHHILLHRSRPLQMKPQVPTQHQIQHHEQILVVLERIPQVADERKLDFLEEPTFLDNVFDSPHTDTFCLIDVFECVDFFGLFVLNHAYFSECPLADGPEEMEM